VAALFRPPLSSAAASRVLSSGVKGMDHDSIAALWSVAFTPETRRDEHAHSAFFETNTPVFPPAFDATDLDRRLTSILGTPFTRLCVCVATTAAGVLLRRHALWELLSTLRSVTLGAESGLATMLCDTLFTGLLPASSPTSFGPDLSSPDQLVRSCRFWRANRERNPCVEWRSTPVLMQCFANSVELSGLDVAAGDATHASGLSATLTGPLLRRVRFRSWSDGAPALEDEGASLLVWEAERRPPSHRSVWDIHCLDHVQVGMCVPRALFDAGLFTPKQLGLYGEAMRSLWRVRRGQWLLSRVFLRHVQALKLDDRASRALDRLRRLRGRIGLSGTFPESLEAEIVGRGVALTSRAAHALHEAHAAALEAVRDAERSRPFLLPRDLVIGRGAVERAITALVGHARTRAVETAWTDMRQALLHPGPDGSLPAACSPGGLCRAHDQYLSEVHTSCTGGMGAPVIQKLLEAVMSLCRACAEGPASELWALGQMPGEPANSTLTVEEQHRVRDIVRESWTGEARDALKRVALYTEALKRAAHEAAAGAGGGGSHQAHTRIDNAVELAVRLE
jgi:hypothetical protein